MLFRNTTAREWILRYVEMRHDLNDPKEALRLAQSANYLDQNADVTDTGKLLFEFGKFEGVDKNKQHQFA